jgi:rare lipoprotein A
MKRKLRKLDLNQPWLVWLLAGGSSLAVAVAAVTFAVRTVHADVRLSRPVVTMGTAPGTPTPAMAAQDAMQAQERAIKRGDRLHGIASWYGRVFNGRKTASGERYNMHAMTACHPTLPFGSLVRVVNPANHKSVVVKITDRGDLVEEGRIIDLSYEAAKRLAMAHDGLAQVDLVVLSLGER